MPDWRGPISPQTGDRVRAVSTAFRDAGREIILVLSERQSGFARQKVACRERAVAPLQFVLSTQGRRGGRFSPRPSHPEGEDGADEIVDSAGKLALSAELLPDADKHQCLDGGVPGNSFHDRPSVAEAAAGDRSLERPRPAWFPVTILGAAGKPPPQATRIRPADS